MPRIDIDAAPTGHGTTYPDAHAGPCLARRRWRLGDAAGLSQFGVNLLRLPAGAWSSQRHWHVGEDEFVWVVEGDCTLVQDEGETVMLAPASGFYSDPACGRNEVRIAYVLKKEDLERALVVLGKALEAYNNRK